jgi:hypothetical protein
LATVYVVQSLGHLGVLVFGQELGDRGRIELASRNPEPLGERVGGLEEVIR